jgi:hypothetical protein
MNDKVVLEWAYEPINYVEEPFPIKGSDHVTRQNTEVPFNYSICIGNGKAKISLESQDEYGGDMIEIIRGVLSRRFLAISLKTRERCKLGKILEIHPDGSRAFLMSTCGQCDQSRATVKDYLIRQEDGSIRLDTRTETLEEKIQRNIEENIELYPKTVAEKRRLGELYQKFQDDYILKIIMERYDKACQTDDATGKSYSLYDIRDAIREHFQNENNACAQLEKSITSKEAIEKHLQSFIAKAIAKAIAIVIAISIAEAKTITIVIAIAEAITKTIVKDEGLVLDESKTDIKKILGRFGEKVWALDESKTDMEKIWSRFGRLANDTELGRHSGEKRVKLEQLRMKKEVKKQKLLDTIPLPLTDVLNELEEHATFLIELYLNYLEHKETAKLEKHPQ